MLLAAQCVRCDANSGPPEDHCTLLPNKLSFVPILLSFKRL